MSPKGHPSMLREGYLRARIMRWLMVAIYLAAALPTQTIAKHGRCSKARALPEAWVEIQFAVRKAAC